MTDICKYCNKEFSKNRKDKVFCSRKCKVKSKDKRLERRRIRNRNKVKSRRLNRIEKHRAKQCKNCGFVAIHRCQLDIDHIDGNHQNNSPENLQTLCANCHRLKTFINKDWEKR